LCSILVAVAYLNLCFRFYLELGKVDKFPAREFPHRSRRDRFTSRFVLEANDEMHRVIAHFVGRCFRLEIKRAETAVAAPRRIKFWVQIKYALALQIDYAQVGIT